MFLLQVPCKIIHISCGSDLTSHLEEIAKHFIEFGSPIMMGRFQINSVNYLIYLSVKYLKYLSGSSKPVGIPF